MNFPLAFSRKFILLIALLACGECYSQSAALTKPLKYGRRLNEVAVLVEKMDKNALKTLDSLKLICHSNNEERLEVELIYLEAVHFKNHKRFNVLRNLVRQGLILCEKMELKGLKREFMYLQTFVLQYDKKFSKEIEVWKSLIADESDPERLARFYNGMGNSYTIQKDYKRSTEAYNRAKYYLTRLNDTRRLSQLQSNIAINYFFNNKPDSAFVFFYQARKYCVQNDNEYDLVTNDCNLAEAFLAIGKLDSANYYLNHALQTGLKSNYQQIQYFSLKEDFFKQSGKLDSAYVYSLQKFSLQEKLSLEDSELLSDEFDFLYKMRETELKSARREKQLQEEKNRSQRILFIVIFGAGVLLLALTAFIVAYKTQSRNNSLLREQKRAITEQNTLIDASLKEKEILLKEIHHRVKNNLQIISSLLNLQSKSIDDPKALAAIEEGRERIFAIALIHQKLYQSNNFAAVGFQEYLTDLMNDLKNTYARTDQNLTFEIDAENILLNIDTAVPLGLVICELITNSFKHAFANTEFCKISISLKSGEEGFTLVYSDNGSGFLKDKDFPQTGSLGAEIIVALVGQLEGSIRQLETKQGVCFLITLKQL